LGPIPNPQSPIPKNILVILKNIIYKFEFYNFIEKILFLNLINII